MSSFVADRQGELLDLTCLSACDDLLSCAIDRD